MPILAVVLLGQAMKINVASFSNRTWPSLKAHGSAILLKQSKFESRQCLGCR